MSAKKLYRPPITPQAVKEVLDYNPDTGIFTWKIRSGKAFVNQVAGSLGTHGYLTVTVFQKKFLIHRLAWFLTHGIMPGKGEMIDHINRNKLDNRIANLRLATPKDNNGNAPILTTNTSGYRGVSWDKKSGAWACYIWNKNKKKHLGRYSTAEIAAKVYDRHAKEYFGQYYANLNFPESI